MDPAAVFEDAYRERDSDELSWHQAEPVVSLELLDLLGVTPDRSLVDVGGGASPLASRLLERGFADLTVLDVSAAALAAAQRLLGPRAGEVTWLVQDVRTWRPERRFDVWHDRATLHFLVEPRDRERYLDTLERALADDGVAVLATFAPDGPERCSGLPVLRYDTAGLAALAPHLELVGERRETHRTPRGTAQPFTWVALRRAR